MGVVKREGGNRVELPKTGKNAVNTHLTEAPAAHEIS